MTDSEITVLYYDEHAHSMEIKVDTLNVLANKNGRPLIPENFKRGKLIVAVLEGKVKVLNKMGDRVEHRHSIAANS